MVASPMPTIRGGGGRTAEHAPLEAAASCAVQDDARGAVADVQAQRALTPTLAVADAVRRGAAVPQQCA